MEGNIFDIQHFCTGDGPGIRTTVFLKGCTLKCAWCHNPESQSFAPEILLNTPKCIGCGACDSVCPQGDAKAVLADALSRQAVCPPQCRLCADACPSGCLETVGRRSSVEEVMAEVMQDEAYYRHSSGGMTLSGGEPMAQPAFCRQLLQEASQRGIHTAMETSGNGRREDYLAAAPYVKLWLWDVKLMDAGLYRKYVGGELQTMLDNLRAVSAAGSEIRFRVLFIPELHSSESILEATAALIKEYGHSAEVIPYHLLGNAKRGKLGLPEIRFREPESSETEAFARRIGVL